MRILILTAITCCSLLYGCASENPVIAKDGDTIAQISISHNGDTEKTRPNMASICKGFLLSKQQVQDFFVNADHVYTKQSNNSDDRLPCFASGTALINNKPYLWVIRSGGIGIFTGKNSQFQKVCGKGCCSKVSGVC